jgi:hypothetical protein
MPKIIIKYELLKDFGTLILGQIIKEEDLKSEFQFNDTVIAQLITDGIIKKI